MSRRPEMAHPPSTLVEARFHEALALHRQGRRDEAAEIYRQVLDCQPRHVQALTFLGVIAFESNQFEHALELASRALEVDPTSAATHLMRGRALARLERPVAAIASYDDAISLNPAVADLHLHRANALLHLGRRVEGLASLTQALELAPHVPETHYKRGLVLHELGRYHESLADYERTIALDPSYAEVHDSRGTVLKDLHRYEEALASYERAIVLKPDYARAYSNRGNLLATLGRHTAALASYDAALSLTPEDPDVHCNRGNLLGDLGRHEEALASLDRAVSLDADHAQSHFSRAFVHLMLGDFASGWRDFEWRWRSEHCVTSREKRNFPQPLWSGETDIAGKTLFVYCEQGFGDTLQFCRYLPHVARLGARVVVEVPRALRRLLESMSGVTQWVTSGEALPPFDYYCPMLSLPLAFKTTLATIPAAIPYLQAGAEQSRYWKGKLGERTRTRVGLVWSGGLRPDQPELCSVNNRRNIPLALLAPLRHSGVEFYSLQKGQPAEDDLALLTAQGWQGPALIDHTRELRDFADTAALIEQLDLVISVDTSTAHLAGALGKPVWILNRFDTCWRWLLDRSDSPWYPTVRLYRQQRAGDWGDVVDRVRRDLERFAKRPAGSEAQSPSLEAGR
jgi:tetratricopeptide (TPR) repeat protein